MADKSAEFRKEVDGLLAQLAAETNGSLTVLALQNRINLMCEQYDAEKEALRMANEAVPRGLDGHGEDYG